MRALPGRSRPRSAVPIPLVAYGKNRLEVSRGIELVENGKWM